MSTGEGGMLRPDEIGSGLPTHEEIMHGVDPESPPGEGVGQESPPPGEQAPEKLADGTSADKPIPYERFKQVQEQLAQYKESWDEALNDPEFFEFASRKFLPTGDRQVAPQAPAQAPPPPQPVTEESEDDAERWLGDVLDKRLEKHLGGLGEVKEFIEAQKAQQVNAEAQRQLAELEKAHTGFDRTRDLPAILRELQRGAPSLEAAYRIAFYGRGEQPRGEAPPPDLGGAPASAGSDDLDDILANIRKAKPNDQYDRDTAADAYIDQWAKRTGLDKALGL